MTDTEITAALEARKPEVKQVIKQQAKGTGFVDDDDDSGDSVNGQ